MDIPETGAVFTIGKSYLSDNHQSYFFIKNDPIRKLICGIGQSAVICESGRLFVWGENQFGQLGIGSAEIVTKPSCVKAIKTLGYKVRNVAYGEGFGVILTENSKIFFTGKNIFNGYIKDKSKFWSLGNGALVTRKMIEIDDFGTFLNDSQGNELYQFVDVAAGDEHFVLLTSSGKLYGWGLNTKNQLGKQTTLPAPTQISQNEIVRFVSCGKTSTAFITGNNEIYIVGTLNSLHYPSLTKVNTASFDELMYSMYISHENELYLVFSSGEIFKSVEVDEIGFQPYNMINENIRKVCTGNGFEAIVTESNKLLTTFSEKSSARSTNGYIKIPRELKKFANLDILDAVSGANHMLVHAVQKCTPHTTPEESSMNDFDVSCGEMHVNEMNDLNRTYTKMQQQLSGGDSQSQIEEENGDDENENQPIIEEKLKNGSKIPISEQMMTKRRLSSNNSCSLPTSRKNSDEGTANLQQQQQCAEIDNNLNEIMPGSIEKSLSLKEFESLEKEHAIANDNSNNDTEVKLVNVEEVDERVSTSADSKKTNHSTHMIVDDQKEEHQQPTSGEFLIAAQTPPHWIKTPPPVGGIEIEPIIKSATAADVHHPETINKVIENQLNKDEQLQVIVQQTEEGTSIAEIRRQSTDDLHLVITAPADTLKRIDSDITFINDGVDVTQEIVDMNNSEPEDEQLNADKLPTNVVSPVEKMVDSLLGEKLLTNYVVKPIMDTKEETKKALEEVFVETTKSPDKDDGDSERTTASISSLSPDKSHPIGIANGNGSTTSLNNKNVKENGKVRRFFNDLKTKGRNISCSNSNAVASVVSDKNDADEAMILAMADNRQTINETNDKKSSKFCTIS